MLEQYKNELEYLKETLEEASCTAKFLIEMSGEMLYSCEKDFQEKAEHNLFYFDSINFILKDLIKTTDCIDLDFKLYKNTENTIIKKWDNNVVLLYPKEEKI